MSRAFLKGAGRVGETRRRLTQTPHLKVDPSPSLSLATLVTPTTSTPVQDNISIILPLVFHLASTHLGRDTQRQIHWSVEGPRGSETPTKYDTWVNEGFDSHNKCSKVIHIRCVYLAHWQKISKIITNNYGKELVIHC
jgi:hypothetical protein